MIAIIKISFEFFYKLNIEKSVQFLSFIHSSSWSVLIFLTSAQKFSHKFIRQILKIRKLVFVIRFFSLFKIYILNNLGNSHFGGKVLDKDVK
jgi:hypothetical protein